MRSPSEALSESVYSLFQVLEKLFGGGETFARFKWASAKFGSSEMALS